MLSTRIWSTTLALAPPALRALRTERTTKLELEPPANIFGEMARAKELYFGGDMEAAIALTGQVAGRIGSVRPVKEILDGIMAEYAEAVRALPAA